MRKERCPPSQQSGFTLIEALVALLVLSIGLLGAAALQLKALQGAQSGYQRAVASLAAQDAVERLWAQFDSERNECNGLEGETGEWERLWQDAIPGLSGTVEPAAGDCTFHIVLAWDAPHGDAGETRLAYTARLPGSGP